MKPWLWTMLCLGCLALAGCRANSYQTMLEQESRQWEDRFYVVKDRLDQCQAELDASRQRNRELEGDVGGPSSSDLHDALIFPGLKSKSGGALAPPSVEGMSSDRFQKVAPDSLPLKTPEKIESGNSQLPSTSPNEPGSDAPLFKELDSSPKPDMNRGSNRSGDSREVARIELIGMSTDGYDSDFRPGDDGVQFVLQPRDANGKAVDAAAPISIVVVDPLPQGKSVRLARWDLTPQQAAGYYERSPRGFHLRLPWPGATPQHSRLRLFARYTTADGRKVQAEKAITVAIADEQRPNWSIDPPPELSQSTATPQSPTTATPQARQQPDQPRVAAQPQRKRPPWSPDRP